MKTGFTRIGLSILFGFFLPVAVVFSAVSILQYGSAEEETGPSETVLPPSPVTAETPVPRLTIPVLLHDEEPEQMDLNDYLLGVLLAEMPAEFEPEALKAQAVVSGTYVIRRNIIRDKHDGAVCTNSSCCQAYREPDSYLKDGGTPENLKKVRDAVEAVSGQVLTYEGEPIEATFFSCSGGSTESAVAVWGSDIPYLQATPSPGEEIAVHYEDSLTFSREELESSLGIDLTGSPGDWFADITYTDGGGINTVRIGDEIFTGVQLRKLLNLRSTNFSAVPSDDNIIITSHGFGHRVGMSQYGAQAMALNGHTYDEILAHYYKDTILTFWNN